MTHVSGSMIQAFSVEGRKIKKANRGLKSAASRAITQKGKKYMLVKTQNCIMQNFTLSLVGFQLSHQEI